MYSTVQYSQLDMYSWSSLLSVFIYSSSAVFEIVGGQPTTDGDYDKTEQLTYTVARQQAQLNSLRTKLARLEADQATNRPDSCK